ncbi:alpha-glucosidase [Salimicrobium sp. PL1-032A]|uniref:alpha-glucosidase n=1 Tax=Salimicrobium sp. PL1-032A TaxID=3095364 RepID=UPI003261C530
MSSSTKEYLEIHQDNNFFEIVLDGKLILRHTFNDPCVYVGKGQQEVEMYRGNFDIKDNIEERIGLRCAEVVEKGQSYKILLKMSENDQENFVLYLRRDENKLKLDFSENQTEYNRFWIRINAHENEKVYGCGEQMSHLNLRGKNFPLWTSEPGVGRNKKTYTTWQADIHDKAGGDYYHTNYPQPTYLSSKKYYCHVDTTAYADFNFRNSDFHELYLWEVPNQIIFETGDTFKELLSNLTELLGRQPALPEWVYDGIWLGMQGGTELVDEKINHALDNNIKLGAVWVQDWQGKRLTSFGRRLNWNWEWDPDEYPKLDQKLIEWKEKGIRFLGYINPYVITEGNLYQEAENKDYLVQNQSNQIYKVDFGEFYCGIVDLTNPHAFEWYKKVIKTNLIDFGLDGWMADFGEYLPTDAKLYNGQPGVIMHNAWPMLWAKLNYEAIEEAGELDNIVFFMRAGYTGSQKYCRLLWAGDQSVNWEYDDGIASVIPAALSAGLTGNGFHHSDIGGYTNLHGNKRSKELLLRWLEMATFTPVMRSHEGNRPLDGCQYDHDAETMEAFARMTSLHVDLTPYIKQLVEKNAREGIPVQRPLFMEYEEDENAYNIQYQYMFGKDILVAPVLEEAKEKWGVYLPEDEWVHLWSNKEYTGGNITVDAPIGEPPVFYRKNSLNADLFRKLGERYSS